MSDLLSDVRYGLRQLRRTPGLTLAAVLCVMLGIGANTATFSFARGLLMRDAGIHEPERLVRMYIHWESGLRFGSFSYPDYEDLRDRNEVFEGLAVEGPAPLNISSGGRSETILGSIVSGNYFDVLGVSVTMGRSFRPEESATPNTHPVVVVSHGFWQRRLGGDPGVLGGEVLVNGQPFSVVGVAPEGFTGPNVGLAPELWAPMMMQDVLRPGDEARVNRGDHWIGNVMGRMRAGVTQAQAQQNVDAVMASLTEEYPDTNRGVRVQLYPEAEASLHPRVRGAFVGFMSLMFGVVGLVLLLTCTNVAGLLLARYAARGREIAVRAAIGADRKRLIRQLLVESALLATLAGVAGLVFGAWLVRAIARFQPPGPIPMHFDIGLDPSVVAFTLAATLLTAFLFGIAPALHASRLDLVPALKEGTAASTGGASRLRTTLVVGQVALSLVLLVGAGLAITSLRNARSLSPGFEPDGQLTARLDLALQGYGQEAARQFVATLRDEAGAVPGVSAVGFAVDVPLSLSSRQRGAVPEGFVVEEGTDTPSIDYNYVDEGYFEAMGIPLLRGRGFGRTDGPDAEPVLVINRAFAERYWPGEDPIGRVVQTSGRPHSVVGLVPTGRYFSLGEEPKPFMYLPLAQNFRAELNVHVRTSGDPAGLATTLRKRVAALDAALPFRPRSMHETMGLALLPARMAAGTVSVFAGVALLLAAVGLYGVLAFLVRQSSREIAIRMAVGARANHVLALVIGRGLRLVAWGIAIGLPVGALLARPMSGLLYGVGALDLPSFGLAVGGLLLVTAGACLLPARRATRVDPLAAMRIE